MERTELIMGMPITVAIPPTGGAEPPDSAFAAVWDWFREVDLRYSPYKPDSEVSRISRGELPPAQASAGMREIIRMCDETAAISDGYFSAWFEGRFDPSGLVKGWAIGQASTILEGLGFPNHCIEAGGDIEVKGFNKQGLPWEIGIRNPRDTATIIKVLKLSGRGIATSGTYIRGRHIYNPKTGQRVEGVPSLSVVGPTIYEADRLVTAAYAMGDSGINWLMAKPGIDVYQVGHDGKALYTPGLARYL